MKRGTEDLDFFIGDEALAAANGGGELHDPIQRYQQNTTDTLACRLRYQLSHPTRTDRELGTASTPLTTPSIETPH